MAQEQAAVARKPARLRHAKARAQPRRRHHRRRCHGSAAADLIDEAPDRASGAAAHRHGDEVVCRLGPREDNPAGDTISAAVRNNRVALSTSGRRRTPRWARRSRGCGSPARILAPSWRSSSSCSRRVAPARCVKTRWEEVDHTAAVWSIPRQAHEGEPRAPRAAGAPGARVLAEAAELFRRRRARCSLSPAGRILNHATITKLLADLGIDAVAHGFRSSFHDWNAECTGAPREVCELALARVNRDRVEPRTGTPTCSRSVASSWTTGPPASIPAIRRRHPSPEPGQGPPGAHGATRGVYPFARLRRGNLR